MQQVRFGILGAARIAPRGLIHPARSAPGVAVAAVAARAPDTARAYAAEHGIPRVLHSYQALVDDPGLDAVYVALPNAAHATWAVAALRAGKHVLVEKPAAVSAAQARRMFDEAGSAARLCVEAMHYRHHPFVRQALDQVHGGAVGDVLHVEAGFTAPLRRADDIRYDAALAGGALRDLGCYCLHWVRQLAAGRPVVRGVEADWMAPGVDRAMWISLDCGGFTAQVRCAFERRPVMRQWSVIRGSTGTLRLNNLFIPGWFGSMQLERATGVQRWRAERRSSYAWQLDAFVQRVRAGSDAGAPAADAADTIENLALMDAVLGQAGRLRD
jgi:predicted dehydrogenase